MRIRAILFGYETPFAPVSPPPPPPPPPGVPAAPTDLALTSRTDTTATFSFTDNASTETGFRIKADGSNKGTAAADASSITASGLTEGTGYDFVCVAYNGSGESPDSNTVTAYTQLAAPTDFSGVLSGGTVTFTWTDNSSNNSEYQMQKDSADEGSPLGASTTQYQVDEGDAAGTWKVNARASGIPASDYSGSVSGPPWPE